MLPICIVRTSSTLLSLNRIFLKFLIKNEMVVKYSSLITQNCVTQSCVTSFGCSISPVNGIMGGTQHSPSPKVCRPFRTLFSEQILQIYLALDHLGIFALGQSLCGDHRQPRGVTDARLRDKSILAFADFVVLVFVEGIFVLAVFHLT